MGWFQKSLDLQTVRPDVGPQPQRRFGVTGASNFQIIASQDQDVECYWLMCRRCRVQSIRHELQRHHRHAGHRHGAQHCHSH